MQKFCFILLFTFYSVQGFSQLSQTLSIEGGINYNYYISGSTPYNFGFSILLFNKIGKTKIGFGINPCFSTYSETHTPNGLTTKERVQYDYTGQINFWQLIAVFGIKENKKININFSTGLIWAQIKKQRATTHYNDGTSDSENIYSNEDNFGLVRLSLVFQKNLNERYSLVFVPSFDWRVTYNEHSTSSKDIILNGVSNFKIGVNYTISKN